MNATNGLFNESGYERSGYEQGLGKFYASSMHTHGQAKAAVRHLASTAAPASIGTKHREIDHKEIGYVRDLGRILADATIPLNDLANRINNLFCIDNNTLKPLKDVLAERCRSSQKPGYYIQLKGQNLMFDLESQQFYNVTTGSLLYPQILSRMARAELGNVLLVGPGLFKFDYREDSYAIPQWFELFLINLEVGRGEGRIDILDPLANVFTRLNIDFDPCILQNFKKLNPIFLGLDDSGLSEALTRFETLSPQEIAAATVVANEKTTFVKGMIGSVTPDCFPHRHRSLFLFNVLMYALQSERSHNTAVFNAIIALCEESATLYITRPCIDRFFVSLQDFVSFLLACKQVEQVDLEIVQRIAPEHFAYRARVPGEGKKLGFYTMSTCDVLVINIKKKASDL